MTQTTINNQALLKQLQYYLSEQNLQNDEFFYNQVASNNEHYVKINCFLKCNKIKKLNITKAEQIANAIKQKDSLELNEDKTMLRKKGLDDLPEFKPKKKIKSQDVKLPINPYDKIDPIIFVLSIEKDQPVPFRYINQALLKNHNLYSHYARFNKNQGHFLIDSKNSNPEVVQRLEKDGLKIGEAQIHVKKAGEQECKDFWQKHGHHYKGIVDNLRKDFNKKQKEEQKHQKNSLTKQFQFSGQKYTDINKLKSIFTNILHRNANNTPLKDNESKLVKQLLSYHDHGDKKLENFKYFVVDIHPNFIDNRCFFVVKEDDTREDFSTVKCLNNIKQRYG